MADSVRNKAIAFVALTFALSFPFYVLIISAGTVNAAGGLYVAGIMWCPGLACLLTRLIFQRNLRGVGGVGQDALPGVRLRQLRRGHDLFGIVTTASPCQCRVEAVLHGAAGERRSLR